MSAFLGYPGYTLELQRACTHPHYLSHHSVLPLLRLQVGDLFVIHDTGAHSHSMGFQYNGKLRAPELLLRDPAVVGSASSSSSAPRVDVIRDRETIHCLFDNTHMPADLDPHTAGASGKEPYPYAGRPAPPAAADATPAMTSSVKGPDTKKRSGVAAAPPAFVPASSSTGGSSTSGSNDQLPMLLILGVAAILMAHGLRKL